MKHRGSAWDIWRWPLLMAALTISGLLLALIGHGDLWWPISWITLAAPLVVAALHLVSEG